MYESDRRNIKHADGSKNMLSSMNCENSPLEKTIDTRSEPEDIFPALQKYKDEHSATNLQKLMVEILEFCRSVYASTQNEAEREIYHSMIEKLNK